MSNQILVYLIGVVGALFGVIVVIYYMMSQKMNGKNTKYVAQLVEGTKKSSFSMDVFYQKFYVRVVRLPFIKRYALKLRRRLEILNLEDEFITRKQVAQIVFKALMIIIPLTGGVIYITINNYLLMASLLLFEIFFLETLKSVSPKSLSVV